MEKLILLILFSFIFSLNLIQAQDETQSIGSAFGLGVSNLSHQSKEVAIRTEEPSIGYFLSYEAVTYDLLSVGFKWLATYPTQEEDLFFWDFRLQMGTEINRSSRLQFPIRGHISVFGLNDKVNPNYGNAGFGFEGGVRFYLTGKIAIDGTYNYCKYYVSTVGDEKYKDAIGNIQGGFINVGLSFFLNDK